ncbi:hypothetical protein F2P81_015660 [Scophthalmus maximus]|uniref:Uncharacterized protein n=1 Tax=Scophthalmus maximus TaxID=52904 RepID=A0A6A4SEY9_SCOMX|nr:hypothetical protein F2P81_015660 [Scophthalmus maximus]
MCVQSLAVARYANGDRMVPARCVFRASTCSARWTPGGRTHATCGVSTCVCAIHKSAGKSPRCRSTADKLVNSTKAVVSDREFMTSITSGVLLAAVNLRKTTIPNLKILHNKKKKHVLY